MSTSIGEQTVFDGVESEQATATLSWEDIYRKYYQNVFRTCLKLLKNKTEAEDITQDVFLQVQRNWHRFRGEASPATWLYRIAVNQVYMYWRKKSVRTEVASLAEVTENARPFAAGDNSQASAVTIALLSAINDLPDGMRTVLTLHDIYGYHHDEIGKILKIDGGTSKSQLHKARLKLREILRSR